MHLEPLTILAQQLGEHRRVPSPAVPGIEAFGVDRVCDTSTRHCKITTQEPRPRHTAEAIDRSGTLGGSARFRLTPYRRFRRGHACAVGRNDFVSTPESTSDPNQFPLESQCISAKSGVSHWRLTASGPAHEWQWITFELPRR
jgi:hypothetical protein